MEDSRKRSSKSKKDPAKGYLVSWKTGGKTDVGEKRKRKGAKSKDIIGWIKFLETVASHGRGQDGLGH